MARRYNKRDPQFPAAPGDTQDGLPSAADLDHVAEEENIKAATAAPVPLPPPPPNPHVLELQGDVVMLVRTRGEVRRKLLAAHGALQSAQATFQMAQQEMKTIEDEVQYLHSQIAQMEGRPAEVRMSLQPFDASGYASVPSPMSGISSEPTIPPTLSFPRQSSDGVNRAHAVREVL